MKVRETKRPALAILPDGCPQVTYRGTRFGTIMLRDEFRSVEMIGAGAFVGVWEGTPIECNVPNWIRRAGVLAYLALKT